MLLVVIINRVHPLCNMYGVGFSDKFYHKEEVDGGFMFYLS